MSKVDFFAYSPAVRQPYKFCRKLADGNEFSVWYVGLDTVDSYEAQAKAADYTRRHVGYPEVGMLPEEPLDGFRLTEDTVFDIARVELALSLGNAEARDGTAVYSFVELAQMMMVKGPVFEALLKDVNTATAKVRRLDGPEGNASGPGAGS